MNNDRLQQLFQQLSFWGAGMGQRRPSFQRTAYPKGKQASNFSPAQMQAATLPQRKQSYPWRLIGVVGVGVLVFSTATVLWMQRSANTLDLEQLTVPVKSESLTLRIRANGTITPSQSVNLSPKVAGVLKELLVEQGDRVEAGQRIARMDNRDLEGQLIQAQGVLRQTEARLVEVRRGNRPEEIAQAKARLNRAEAELAEAKANRPEEIAEAESQVAAAQATANLARTRVGRYRKLAEAGAETRDRLDEVIADNQSTQANLKEAQQRLARVTERTRRDIDQAAANLREAQQAYQLSLKGNRPEVIAQAEAAVLEAKGRLRTITNQLDDTVIRAPFSGIVTQKYATEGAFVTPTTSASSTSSATSASIVAIAANLEVLADVPEVDIGQIRLGQRVEIRADSYPDQVFEGRVRLVSPEAVVDQNVTSFQVRVTITSGRNQLRSGMNSDLTFLGNRVDDALVVPTVSIATRQGQTGVYIPGEDNKPKFQPVTLGSTLQAQTQVIEGLKPDQRVFIDFPDGLKPEHVEE